MKAMILAAGLGTRLRPLTDTRPKALVEIGARTLLEITLGRLRAIGIREVIINVHHLGEMIVDYLQANANFGMQVEISREDVLLDTGGGLKKAGWFFRDSEAPFILHNVDVLSNLDLKAMIKFHVERRTLATLAVNKRQTSRPLLFDENGEFRGRAAAPSDPRSHHAPTSSREPFGFCGIHIISARFLSLITENGAFSVIDTYQRLAASGEKIIAFRADQYYWRDLGKIESVQQAERDLQDMTP